MSVSILQKSCVQNNSHPQQPKSEILPKALGTRIAWKRLLIIVYGASNHENKHACFFKRTSTVSSIYRVWVHFYKIWTGLVVQHDHPGPFFSLLSNSLCWSRVSGMEKKLRSVATVKGESPSRQPHKLQLKPEQNMLMFPWFCVFLPIIYSVSPVLSMYVLIDPVYNCIYIYIDIQHISLNSKQSIKEQKLVPLLPPLGTFNHLAQTW